MTELQKLISGAIMIVADGKLSEREINAIVPEITERICFAVSHAVSLKTLKSLAGKK